jgi:beta-mannosidase
MRTKPYRQCIAVVLAIAIASLIAIFQSSAEVASTHVPSMIPLSGTWEFAPELRDRADLQLTLKPTRSFPNDLDRYDWQEIKVPANWYLQQQDLSGAVWYRYRFHGKPQLNNKLVRLVFEGVDYAADVWLNGEYLGFHEGYFQPFGFWVSPQLNFDRENTLLVRVNSPKEDESKPDWSLHKRLIKGIFSHHDTRPGGAWTDRAQEKNTGGIWAPVYLQVSEKVAIADVLVTPQLQLEQNQAIANVDLLLTHPQDVADPVEIKMHLVPHNFSGSSSQTVTLTQQLKGTSDRIQLSIAQDNPKLWWSWEHGDPNLYKLAIEVSQSGHLLDRKDVVFGFRSIQLEPKTKTWKLNGKPIFLRGTNYIATQWLSEMTPEKYSFDLALMKRANINAIRVHAHIAGREFYRLSDEMGFLIWQDFPLQWGYEESLEFRAEATKQAKDMVRLLYNHPAIVAWCLHNEPPWDANWMQYKYRNYNPNQNRSLNAAMYDSVKNIDLTRYLHPYSSVREHPWLGWYSGSWLDYAKPTQEPMITEFGAQALPNITSLRRIFTETELFPNSEPVWKKWEYHNFQRHETFDLAKVSMGKNRQEFVDNTQKNQARSIEFTAEALRRQRFHPVTSIFQFMFVEDWPSVNWGIVDYWRNPKPAYEALKTAYQPVLPSIAWLQEEWKFGETIHLDLWIINDLWQSFPNAKISYAIARQGFLQWQQQQKSETGVDISPNSGSLIQTVQYQPKQVGKHEIVVKIFDRNDNLLGQNSFAFAVKPSEKKLPPSS